MGAPNVRFAKTTSVLGSRLLASAKSSIRGSAHTARPGAFIPGAAMAMSAKRASMQWRASIANLPPPPTWTVQLPRGGPSVTFEWSLTGQHTLTWRESVKVKKDGIVTTLGAGSCNLYQYPRITLAPSCAQGGDEPTHHELHVLKQIILKLVSIRESGRRVHVWHVHVSHARIRKCVGVRVHVAGASHAARPPLTDRVALGRDVRRPVRGLRQGDDPAMLHGLLLLERVPARRLEEPQERLRPAE